MFISDGKNPRLIKLIAGSGGVTRGDLCVISSGKVVKAAAAITAATLLGVAAETGAADAVVTVELIDNHIITAPVAGSSKTSLADTDIGSVFDLTDEKVINLDDTTGGCMLYIGGYNSGSKTANFVIPESFKYL